MLFLQKYAKFLSAGGSAPRPLPFANSAPRPPASGSWGLRPQTPKTAPPPISNFWLRACFLLFKFLICFRMLVQGSGINAEIT